ncbi:MAG: 4-alpha-glucanotransferase [Acidobacteriota bacterium]
MESRTAGLLLHPTALPGPYGIGDLGPAADRFLDWAAAAGQRWWQILPLTPPDGCSPYSCLSSFAGNPLLISPQLLQQQDLLLEDDLAPVPTFPRDQIDLDAAAAWKSDLLRRSWQRFQDVADEVTRQRLQDFRQAARPWLDDWTLFAALRTRHQHRGWWEWPADLRQRRDAALEAARDAERTEIDYQAYLQWLFFEQWRRVKDEATRRGLRILGDLPIYVSWNSAEVWANPHLFELDDEGHPLAVAGVPPDDFSEDGQRWGNPLYRWDRLAEDGYAWWIARLAAVLKACDRVRLDHFRGFAGYWRVPADEPTAVNGEWVDGPGLPFFDVLRQALGDLPLIAEDLGVITPDVEALRRDTGLPGMKVLQFAFGDPESPHWPHRCERDAVVYTGTHDNDTTQGWYRTLDPPTRRRVLRYTGTSARRIHQGLIRLAYTSVADLAIVPLQDVFGLGSEARMNTPGTTRGNWTWRLEPDWLDARRAQWLRDLAEVSGRLPTEVAWP